jgi:hypothetical protein
MWLAPSSLSARQEDFFDWRLFLQADYKPCFIQLPQKILNENLV